MTSFYLTPPSPRWDHKCRTCLLDSCLTRTSLKRAVGPGCENDSNENVIRDSAKGGKKHEI